MASNTNTEQVKEAESTEFYKDATQAMKVFIEKEKRVSLEERDLFLCAYRAVVKDINKRLWHLKVDKIQVDRKSLNGPEAKALDTNMARVVEELCTTCKEAIGLLDHILLPDLGKSFDEGGNKAQFMDSRVLYHNMKGDFYRYMYEAQQGSPNASMLKAESQNAYSSIKEISGKNLRPASPVWLKLVLSYSTFMYEIQKTAVAASRLAGDAMERAVMDMDGLDQEQFQESEGIIQLLSNNLQLWRSEVADMGEDCYNWD